MPRKTTPPEHARTARTTALCYLRKSVVRNGADYASIDIQRAAIVTECALRGWNAEWYEDADGHRSGRHEHTRPEWLKLKVRLADADVAAVVGYRLDRISRSVHDALAIVRECTAHGVAVVTADKLIDTSGGMNAFANIQLNLLAAIAQFESDVASDRLRDRIAAKDQSGINHGKPPFGMVRVGEGNAARFIASTDIPAVILCLELYAGGKSYDDVAIELNREGVKFRSRSGVPCTWGRESVRTVVGNVLRYCGYHIPQTGYDAKNNRIDLIGTGDHAEQWARAIGAWMSPAVEPVIQRVLANKVIERRYKNQITGRPSNERPFLLTPIAFWDGRKLRGAWRPYGRFYLTYRAGVQINADVAESSLVERLQGVRLTSEVRERVRAELRAMADDDRRQIFSEKRAQAKEEQRLLLELLLGKRIAREVYNERFDATQRIIYEADRELSMPTEVDAAMAQLTDLGDMIAEMMPDKQKRAIHHLFERVSLSKEGEVVAADWKPWARGVWTHIRRIYGIEPVSTSQTMPKVGVHHNVCGVKPPSAPQTAPPIPAPLLFWARLPATSPHS